MSLPLHSLIPTTLALSNFFIQNFPHISWYPNWYLGNPYNYLIGPVLPTTLFVLNKFFGLSPTSTYLFILLSSCFIGAVGLFFLTRILGGDYRRSYFSAAIFLILPFNLYLLFQGTGLPNLAFSLLPFLLVITSLNLLKDSRLVDIVIASFISFLILIDISIILPIAVGIISLLIAQKDWKKLSYNLFKLSLTFLLGLSLSTFWYTPKFWLIILQNPSFGGLPLFQLAKFLIQLILSLAPLILAFWVVKTKKLKFSSLNLFGLIFFAAFLFLTLIRFLSDPDFIGDWLTFFLELQFGAAILLSNWFVSFPKIIFRKVFWFLGLFFICLFIYFNLLKSLTSKNSQNYQLKVNSFLKENVNPSERVFLSGSGVFWVNNNLNILQLRGGADQSAIHPFALHAAYQIREGTDTTLTKNWLISLGIRYLLVNGLNSSEPYHDFKHLEKFSSLKIAAQDTKENILYQIDQSQIARAASPTILSVKRPQNGADYHALNQYINTLQTPLMFKYLTPSKIEIQGNLAKNQIISLAQTYDPSWQLIEGRGQIKSDVLGNTVIIPQHQTDTKYILEYQKNPINNYASIISSLILMLIITNFSLFYSWILKLNIYFPIGISEEEE